MTKSDQNDPIMAKNYPIGPKNGQKWSEMFRKMVLMRPVIPTLNCPTEDGEKLPKITKNGLKCLGKWSK